MSAPLPSVSEQEAQIQGSRDEHAYMHDSVGPMAASIGEATSDPFDDLFPLQSVRHRRVSASSSNASSSAQSRLFVASDPTLSSTSNSSATGESSSSERRPRSTLDRGMERVKRWMRSKSPSQNVVTSTWSANSRDHQHHQQQYTSPPWNSQQDLFASIIEGNELETNVRARTHSESDVVRYRPLNQSLRPRSSTEDTYSTTFSNNLRQHPYGTSSSAAAARLSSTAAGALGTTMDAPSTIPPAMNHTSFRDERATETGLPGSATNTDDARGGQQEEVGASTPAQAQAASSPPAISEPERAQPRQSATTASAVDREREARRRWMLINHRFQIVIAAVALVFSLLIFTLMVVWAVWAVMYFFSLDSPCDLPLNAYFWLATVQLFVDVFRSDILRYFFNWDPSMGDRIPFRIVLYNVCYLIYAALVLRLGIMSVFMDNGATCRRTAPQLFRASTAFVSLSLAAWATIIFGYVIPMLVAAAMLTYNGYNPSAHQVTGAANTTQAMLPSVYATGGAPPSCIEQLPVVDWNELQTSFPRDCECCICMEAFSRDDCIVKTACDHIFHKACCKEWLRQARTCPVCRTDIASSSASQSDAENGQNANNQRIPFGPTGRPMAGMMRMFSRSDNDAPGRPERPGSGHASGAAEIEMAEEGRSERNAHNF